MTEFMTIFYDLSAAVIPMLVSVFVLTWAVRLMAELIRGRR